MLALLARNAIGERRHIDCPRIKLPQHGANPPGGQASQAIGRTKGGLKTKLAAAVEAWGRAVAVSLAPGQRHELKAIAPLVPARRGKRAVGDKGFEADTFRTARHGSRVRVGLAPRRRRRRLASFHRGYYRRRHRVENFFCRIKRFRRMATRCEKLTLTFLAFVQFAAALDWLTPGV
jgi:putative transposase